MSSPNLQIPHVAQNQDQKEVTINEAIDRLDNATQRDVTVTFSDANLTLTATQARQNGHIICTGSNTAARRLIFPAGRRIVCVTNRVSGGFPIEVGYSTGGVARVPPQASVWVQGDTTQFFPIGVAFEIAFFAAGTLGNGERFGQYVFSRHATIVSGAQGHRVFALTPPALAAQITIQRNETNIATATIAVNQQTATISFANDVSFEPGDRLAVLGPNPADSAMADLSVTLRGRMT